MTLYLDTSSLVKLYVEEVGSGDVRDLVAEAAVVATSVVAYPETRAALARLRRSGNLSPANFASAKRSFDAQWSAFLTLDVTGPVSREAGEFAERYSLRGFDALHLASFAEVARRAAPGETQFSSFDDPLNRAVRNVLRALLASR
ncbi:MAG TPA: type II toxin-antitoxin system VapC family toxin [Bryobacteraceae bacterium]|nr:type II toxin-antitoxin system VapC family toxin [Bryobacteraceae bacterium]